MNRLNIYPTIIGILSTFLLHACQQPSGNAIEKAKQESNWPHVVFYEIFVQSFYDANGDGIGDIQGMTRQLDYLKDLGIGGIWLMPISPSPSYHKYDVTDYRNIHPDYGTLEDFKTFIREAHARNIHVIIDLVVNHTSSEHPWFQQARADKNSAYRDYYVWTSEEEVQDEIEKEELAADSDNRRQWHTAAGNDALYYGYFIAGMPDLNYDNPKVREEIIDIGRFWLEEVGVDGFRLDAAKHIFPDNRPEDNHPWWTAFRQAMEAIKPDVFLVGEVWDTPEVVAPYLPGLHALFNFELGFTITRVVQQESALNLIDTLMRIRDFYQNIQPDFVDATFITNHDQNRIMSVLNEDESKARMAASLLLTLPGSPFIYYGEEIGMEGMKPDEHIREPFVWQPGDAEGEPEWITPTYSTEEEVTPMTVQQENSNSLYNHYKTLIHLRNDSPILTLGGLAATGLAVEGMASFFRVYEEDTLWVMHNLSDATLRFDIAENMDKYQRIFFTTNEAFAQENNTISFPPYSTVILSK